MGLVEVVDQQKPELQIALSCAVAGLFINRFRAGVVGVPGDGAILCPVRDQSELSLATHDASRVLSLDHQWWGVAGVALVWVAHWQVHSQRGFGPFSLAGWSEIGAHDPNLPVVHHDLESPQAC